jgi:type IV pilus assembly protein PilW
MKNTEHITDAHTRGAPKACLPPSLGRAAWASSGFSLIEMMISLTIGMLIISALVGVLVTNSHSAKSNDRTTELQTNGRYAIDHLKREVRLASYRGFTWAEPTTALSTVIVPPTGECLPLGGTPGSFVKNIRQGIWGANDSNPFSGNCLGGTRYTSDDVLVVRRVGNQIATALTANTFYFRSTYAIGEMFQGVTPPTVAGAPIANFPVQEYVYYIGKDDSDSTLPALRRIALLPNGTMGDEMIVSGIEHMQVQYGRATTDLNMQYHDANTINGTSIDVLPTEWDQVDTVHIWLLVRNSKPEPGYSNTNTYVMGDQSYTVSDNIRRQLLTTVIQLRN